MDKLETQRSEADGTMQTPGIDAEKTQKSSERSSINGLQRDEPQDEPPVEAEKKPFKFKLTVFMLCLMSVVVAMDSVIVAASLPAITVALKGSTLEAFWVGTSYLLAQTASLPLIMHERLS